MKKREKMLMVTFFYDPAAVTPDVIDDSDNSVTEEALSTSIEDCLEKGGLVRVSHVEADLVRLACDRHGTPPAHEWVGLTFAPARPEAIAVLTMGGTAGAH